MNELSMPYGAIWQPKKTIIKESKGNGEIVGLTRKKSALIRWTLTLHVLGHFSSEMHNRSGLATEIDSRCPHFLNWRIKGNIWVVNKRFNSINVSLSDFDSSVKLDLHFTSMNHTRLGGFHTLSCFTACIGKLWADGGLRDLLVDSGVYAGCTVDQMLSGKQLNRAIRGLTLAYKALRSVWFCAFYVLHECFVA
jgi:hypothetical protein